jgi:hypothetical protein
MDQCPAMTPYRRLAGVDAAATAVLLGNDVLVEPEGVVGVVAAFEVDESLVVRSVGGLALAAVAELLHLLQGAIRG